MRKIIAVLLALVMCLSLFVGCKQENTDEVKIDNDISMYVHVKVGGALDARARIIAEHLAKEIGVNVSIVNIEGAGGATCATQMLAQPSSKYDLMFAAATIFGSVPAFTETIYKNEDFTPLAPVDVEQFGLFVSTKTSGFKTFDDVKAYAKDNKLIYGSGGVGNITHLLQAKLYNKLGFDAETLTHNGAVAGVTNCMGGHNKITMAGLETVRSYVESGDIIPVMTFNKENYKGYKGYDVPSITSVGGSEDNEYSSLMAIYCLSSVDEAHTKYLQNALNKVIKTNECQEALKKVGLIETPSMTIEEMKAYLSSEKSVMKDIIGSLKK